MSKMQEWLLAACQLLGVGAAQGPQEVRLSDGSIIAISAILHHPECSQGMLIFERSAGRQTLDAVASEGYPYAILDEPLPDEVFNLDSYREMFLDWGLLAMEK